MEADVIAELAAQFLDGRLDVTEYIQAVEEERNRAMPLTGA
jgi:hypothetical protein